MRFLALPPTDSVTVEIGQMWIFFSTDQRCTKIDDGIVYILIFGSASDFHMNKVLGSYRQSAQWMGDLDGDE